MLKLVRNKMTKIQVVNQALAINEDRKMLREELELVWEFAQKHYKGGNTLEVGAYKGMTSYVFANILDQAKSKSKHYIVDIFSRHYGDTVWDYPTHTPKMLMENMGEFGKYVEIWKGSSGGKKTVEKIKSKKYDYVFHDGDHRHPHLLKDLRVLDGVTDHIWGHDYGHSGVTASVDKFCEENGYEVRVFNPHYGLFEIIK